MAGLIPVVAVYELCLPKGRHLVSITYIGTTPSDAGWCCWRWALKRQRIRQCGLAEL